MHSVELHKNFRRRRKTLSLSTRRVYIEESERESDESRESRESRERVIAKEERVERGEFRPEQQRIYLAWQPKLCRLLAEKTIDVLISSVFIVSSYS